MQPHLPQIYIPPIKPSSSDNIPSTLTRRLIRPFLSPSSLSTTPQDSLTSHLGNYTPVNEVNNFHVSHNYIKQPSSTPPPISLPSLQKDASLPNLPTKGFRFNIGSSISTIPNQSLVHSRSQYSISSSNVSNLEIDSQYQPSSIILKDVQNQQLKASRIPLRIESEFSSNNQENTLKNTNTKEVYKQAAHHILGSPNGLSQTYFTGLVRPSPHGEAARSLLLRDHHPAGSRIETCPTGERSPLYEEPSNFAEKIEKKHMRNANTNFEEKGFIWLDDKENNEEHDEHKSNLLKAKIANAKRFRNRRFVQSKMEYDTLEDVKLSDYFTSSKKHKPSGGLDANEEQTEGEQQNEEGSNSNSEESYSSRFELTSGIGSQNEIRSAFKWNQHNVGDLTCRSILKRTSRTRSMACFDSIKKVTFQGVYKSAPKGKLRQVCWYLAFGPLLLNSVKQWKEEKKVKVADNFAQIYQANKEIFTRFLVNSINEPLMKLCKEKASIRTVKSKITEKGLKKRSLKIHGYIMGILSSLTESILSQSLPPFFYEFLASITENDAMFPNNHLTNFEIKRLEFTHYATTKNMTDSQSKMLIGSHLLLRILLCDLVMRPWEFLPELKRKKFENNRIRNLLSVASIMYHALMDLFNRDNREKTDNQAFIEPNGRLKPTKKLIMATDDDILGDLGDGNSLTESNINNDIVGGFYSRQYVKDFMENHRLLYKQIKESMENILECLYQQVHRVYIEGVTRQRELFDFGKEDNNNPCKILLFSTTDRSKH